MKKQKDLTGRLTLTWDVFKSILPIAICKIHCGLTLTWDVFKFMLWKFFGMGM